METYITICKIDSQQEFFCMAQETQTGALYQHIGLGWGGRWERGSERRGQYKIGRSGISNAIKTTEKVNVLNKFGPHTIGLWSIKL